MDKRYTVGTLDRPPCGEDKFTKETTILLETLIRSCVDAKDLTGSAKKGTDWFVEHCKIRILWLYNNRNRFREQSKQEHGIDMLRMWIHHWRTAFLKSKDYKKTHPHSLWRRQSQ